MQSELQTAGERIREMAQGVVKLEREEAEQRGLAEQAQQDVSRLQGEVQSLSEVMAQRDSDSQVNLHTSDPPSTIIPDIRIRSRLSVRDCSVESPVMHVLQRGCRVLSGTAAGHSLSMLMCKVLVSHAQSPQ